MKIEKSSEAITRRDMLRLSAFGASAWGATLAFPKLLPAADRPGMSTRSVSAEQALYAHTLQSWCDGLLAHQITAVQDPALHGALLCPACGIIHGRCGDAVYPLLRVAHSTGDAKYLRAALLVHEWSERQVSRPDGSWVNDVSLSSWKGITVFRAVALAEALHHHGSLLDAVTRRQWTERLARAAKFLDGFITIETGNINYPITAALGFALCSRMLNNDHYMDRAGRLARTALHYFTANGLLFGEGHPLNALTDKHCHPVDLGYNVEESLPALALYSLVANDGPVMDQTIAAMRTHMEFMLPDGGWDNSWGTRNYKWSWWGSRTSDGCHPAYVLLAQHDPKFREIAWRNLELMAQCTHNGMLYGGPDYFAHGDLPCIHHTFTHAKALATVLDRGSFSAQPAPRTALPREEAIGVKSFPEIATHLAAVGDWRATVTDYDWEYVEHVQSGGAAAGGGHATGGALSMLYHLGLGPILVASMTEYQMIEISNQQAFLDSPHMPLTPRIEYAADVAYTSLSDLAARVTVNNAPGQIDFDAHGRLLSATHQLIPEADGRYHLTYRLAPAAVEIIAQANGVIPTNAPLRFILPVVSRSGESIEQPTPQSIRIAKPKGTLLVSTDAAHGFEAVPRERTFNLVPGCECIALTIPMQYGIEIRIRLEVA
jgi:hypothetical protein